MELSDDNGLVLGKNSIAIDPHKKCLAKKAIITHAHSDHVNLGKETSFLMSNETKKLVETRHGFGFNLNGIPFGKKIQHDGFELSLHNSGHILGSSQVLIEGEKTIAITSDFKLQKSILLNPAKVLKSEILVIESTFGLPSFAFPKRETVYDEMASWIKKSIAQGEFVVLAGYSLGKAQELTAIANKYCNEIPLVHETIFKNNKAYEELGIDLGKFLELNHNLKESNVLIMPPSLVSPNLLQVLEYSLQRKVASAFATGWHYRSFYDKIFHLSDHSDFNNLMQYVKESNPKMVLTNHGYAKEFAGFIQRRLKIPAKPLNEIGQKMIMEYS